MIQKIRKKTIFVILYNIAFVVLFFLLAELLFGLLLNNPQSIPKKLLPLFREYYLYSDRKVIQAIPEFSRYDTALFYTLKPGRFIFSNREYEVGFHVNQLGVRDDEQSLNKPKIAVLGDSYAMGWGVGQKKTFTEILESRIQTPILNLGVSSYGTVREFGILQRIFTDSLQYVIIQYSYNDYRENLSFVNNNNKLLTSSEQAYEEMCLAHQRNQRYYFFKRSILFPKYIVSLFRNKYGIKNKEENRREMDEYDAFLSVISDVDFLPEKTRFIVFNIDYRNSDKTFIQEVKKRINYFPALKERMIFIDLSASLSPDKFFVLDDHMTESGHKIVADRIEKHLVLTVF